MSLHAIKSVLQCGALWAEASACTSAQSELWPFFAADDYMSNPFNMPDCERKLKQLPLITGDRVEMADIEIVVRPDGKNWLLGTGTAGKVRPLRDTASLAAVCSSEAELQGGWRQKCWQRSLRARTTLHAVRDRSSWRSRRVWQLGFCRADSTPVKVSNNVQAWRLSGSTLCSGGKSWLLGVGAKGRCE